MALGLGIETLVYVALAFGLLGFVARDELRLRLLMLCASAMYLLYYGFVNETPLWDPILANGALAAVNVTMIGIVVMERSTLFMSAPDTALYRRFPLMTPGQFRRLKRLARESSGPATLCKQTAPITSLHYIREGVAHGVKDGQSFSLPPHCFVGEVGFVTGRPASATVTIAEGTRVLSWTHADLSRAFERMPSLRIALMAQLNADMAHKVAGSRPVVAPAGMPKR